MIFFPSLYKFKRRFVSLKIVCCHNDTWFHLKLTILKPRDNQCLFLMEMFILRYANVLYIYPKLCLQVCSVFWLRTYLINQYVILQYCSSNLCKWNYLYGDLLFFKIQVNHFMAEDKSFGAKFIQKYILWVRGLVSFQVLRHSFLSLTDCWWLYNIQLKTSRGYSALFWCLCQKLSLSPLYSNKTLLHKSSEQSSLISGPGLNSSPPGAKNPSVVIQQQPFILEALPGSFRTR